MTELTESIDLQQLIAWSQVMGLKLVAALLIFIIGRWVSSLLIRGMKTAMSKARVDSTLASFLGNVAYGVMLAIVVISAVGQLGVSTTSAAALLGGAGVAVGLSLKDQLSSFAAGVMLIMFRPFRTGDFIDAGGVLGTVEELKIVATILKTPNNQQVMVPNAEIWGSTITNYSARATRRIDLKVGISYESDMRKAKDIAMRLITSDERVLAEPAPWVGITDLGDSAVTVTIRPWVKTPDFWQTQCDLTQQIKEQYDANDISIPFPQMDIHVSKDA